MRGRRRRSVARRWTFGIAAAAAVLLAVGIGASLRSRSHQASAPPPSSVAGPADTATALAGEPVLVHAGRAVALSSATSVVAGDRVQAGPGARAALTLSTGTHLVVESGRLAVVDQGTTQTFALEEGSVRASVAKLTSGRRFLLRTDDAEVEVRGTEFRVARVSPVATCGGGTATRVSVSEGVVVVRSRGVEDVLLAGDEWPRGCRNELAVAPSASSATSVQPPTVVAIAPSPKPSVEPAPVAPASELKAQNELFAEGLSARKKGDAPGAIAAFDRFLARYPASALAEAATIERLRLLRGSVRGKTAAKDYLARYPKGSAASEARAILEAP